MCELLAISSSHPVPLTETLDTLITHAGLQGPHKDGWGVVYYDHQDVHLFRGPESGSHSQFLHYLRQALITSPLIISHIRKATHGYVSLANTQPFCRPMNGRMISFAHNGHIKTDQLDQQFDASLQPLGNTDSEQVFCTLLQRLLQQDGQLNLDQQQERINDHFLEFAEQGIFNALLSDGRTLIAFGQKRTQDDGEIRPPGLWYMNKRCPLTDSHRGDEQQVFLVASVPLTSDPLWQPLRAGQMMVVRDGVLLNSY